MSEDELPPLVSAAQRGDWDAIKTLLEKGGDVSCQDANQKTALHWAAYFDEVDIVEELLRHPKCNPNALSKRGETPLHNAAASGSVRALRSLLQSNEVDKDAINIWNETALHVACAVGHKLPVHVLMEFGVKEDCLDLWDRTARDVAADNGYSELFDSTVGKVTSKPVPALFSSKRKALSKLLEFPGHPEDIAVWLEDPLIDPAGADMFRYCAVHKFSSWNKAALLRLLLPKLSTKDVNARGGADMSTPLHCCVDMGARQALEVLLEDGRSHAGLLDAKGRTPLAFAIEQRDAGIIELLERHAATWSPGKTSSAAEIDVAAPLSATTTAGAGFYKDAGGTPDEAGACGRVKDIGGQLGTTIGQALESSVKAAQKEPL